MLKKALHQNLILPLCVCFFLLLSSLSEFRTPSLAQIDASDEIAFCLTDQGDLDDSIFQPSNTDVLPPQLERLPSFQTSGYCHKTPGLHFARGPPLFS